MLAEHELLLDPNYILFVLRIIVSQLLQDFGFNKTLLVQTLLISEHFQRHCLLELVVEYLEHLAEAAFTEAIGDLEAVRNVLTFLSNVLVLVIVETVVVNAVWRGRWTLGSLPLLQREPVDGVVLDNLALLVLHEVLGKVYDGLSWVHWELELLLIIQRAITSLLYDAR